MNELELLIESVIEESQKSDEAIFQRDHEVKDGDFFKQLPNNQDILQSRPWKSNPMYFTKVYVSSLATMKMAIHAVSGGNIEIMGMLIGKIDEKCMIVEDVYALPVEGTETRVNAQAEGYEYMVQYLEANKILRQDQNIVGWYHSHPGYGCWLSGIDVSTQALNQNFQDPYLAIVVDPIKSLKQGKIEIGAFRTFPENMSDSNSKSDLNSKPPTQTDTAKYGIHSSKYYSLDIEIFKSSVEDGIIKLINKQTWINDLIYAKEIKISNETEKIKSISYLLNEAGVFGGINEKKVTQKNRDDGAKLALRAGMKMYGQTPNAIRTSRFKLNNPQFNSMFARSIHDYLAMPGTEKQKRESKVDLEMEEGDDEDDNDEDDNDGDDSDEGMEDDDGETSEDNLSIRNKKFSVPKTKKPKYVSSTSSLVKEFNEIDTFVQGIAQQELKYILEERQKKALFS